MIDLQQFCAKDDLREWLNEPSSDGMYDYASNGRILVRVPARAGFKSRKLADGARKYFDDIKTIKLVAFLNLEDLPADDHHECEHCKGAGMVHVEECPSCEGTGRFSHYGYMYDCRFCKNKGRYETSFTAICAACDGTKTGEPRLIQWGATYIQSRYARLIAPLPGVKVSRPPPQGRATDKIYFRFNDGDGIVMPCLRASRPEGKA